MTDHDLDHDDLNLPIALRRTRRTGTGTGTVRRTLCASGVGLGSAIKNPVAACTREVSPPTPPTTPRRNWKNKITKTKTVRGNKTHFSLGPVGGLVEDELSLSTGLTPMVRRTSLQPPSPAPGSSKCIYKTHNTVTPSRRRSAPAGLSSPTTTRPNINTSNPHIPEVTQRQVLNSRIPKRRTIHSIRRNASLSSALSEEKMNRVYTERRKKEKEAQEAQEEIERLKAELKEKNETIERIERFQNNDDTTVELELPPNLEEVDAGRSSVSGRRSAAVVVQEQPPRSPETPTSNPTTFHTALSMRRGGEEELGNERDGHHGRGGTSRDPFADGGGGQQQHMGMGMALDYPHRQHHDPGSGSETEALSFLTTSQFSEAIRAQLDCSTPPPSGSRARHRRLLPTTTTTTTTTTTAAGIKPFPSPPTTSPIAMAMAMMPVAGPGTELPITPCSNSRHGGSDSYSISRRTSNAITTIHAHNLNDDNEELEGTTPTRPSGPSGSALGSAHHGHHQLQNLSSASTQSQLQNRDQHHLELNDPQTQLQTLTTQNTTLQTSLSRTQRSLRVALQMVKKLQLESEQLRGETLLLQREKRELLEVVSDVSSQVQSAVRRAVERRDEMWKGKMRMLGEGIVEGVRGAFEEVVEEGLGGLDSGVGVGVDEEMPGVEVEVGGYGSLNLGRGPSRKRKRGREEEDDDADEEEEEEEEEDQVYEDMQERDGGDGESCDLGSGNLGAGGIGDNGSYDDGLEDMERRIMRVRERMMRKRRRRTGGFGPEEETDPDA